MSVTKYCLECKAQVSADETVCPFCGGMLSEADPEPEIEKDPEYVAEGLEKAEFFDSALSASEKSSIRIWSIGLIIAAVLSVVLAGSLILNPYVIAVLAVCFVLSVAVFWIPNLWLSAGVTAISLFVAVFSYIKTKSPVGLFLVVVAFYLSYSLFKRESKWRRYRKGERIEIPEAASGTPAFKPYSLLKRVIICVLSLALFGGGFAYSYITQFNEAEKYKDYTVGGCVTDETHGGKVYKNDWIGMSFAVPEGYEIANDEKLGEINTAIGYSDKASQWIVFSAEKDGKKATVMLHNVSTEKFEGKNYIKSIDFTDAEDDKFFKLEFGTLEFDAYMDSVKCCYELAAGKYKYAIVVRFSAATQEELKLLMHDFFPSRKDFTPETDPEETTAEETKPEVMG